MSKLQKLVLHHKDGTSEFIIKDENAPAFDEAQNKTDEEKAQARENIGAVGIDPNVTNALLYVDTDGKVTNARIGNGIDVIYGTGKNIVHGEWENGQYNKTTGEFVPFTHGNNHIAINEKFPVTPSGVYTASVTASGVATWPRLYVYEYDASGNFVKESSGSITPTTSVTFTVSATTTQIVFFLYKEGASWQDIVPQGMMIEPGSSKTEYEPYFCGYTMTVQEKAADSITDVAYAEHASSATVRSIGHRGAPGYAPECTAPSYIIAKKLGFTVVENDVSITNDGKYVMWHDTTLKSGTVYSLDAKQLMGDANGNRYWCGSGVAYTFDEATGTYTRTSVNPSTLTNINGNTLAIADQTFAFLRNIDVGRWKNTKFTGTQMLSFEEWISLCKMLGLECYVDAKAPYTEAQAAELVAIARSKGMLRKCSWLKYFEGIRKADPKARCGMLNAPTENNLVAGGVYANALESGGEGSFFWHPPASSVTAENAAMALEKGYGYEAWYVDVPASVTEEQYYAEIGRLLQCGCQGLSLDNHTVEDFTTYTFGHKMRQY